MRSTRVAWLTVIGLLILGTAVIFMKAKDLYKAVPGDIQPKDVQSSYYEWYAFSSRDGEFKVMLPTPPQSAQETLQDQRTGEKVRYDVYISAKGEAALFAVIRKTYPSEKSIGDVKIFLQNFLADVISGNKNTELIASNEGEFRGHPAINYAIRNKQNYVEGTAFIVGASLYALSYSTNIENTSLGDYQYFIDSFSLTK